MFGDNEGSDGDITLEEDPIIMGVLGYVECLRDEFPEICAAGWTVGETLVPFAPDEDAECEDEDEEGMCSYLGLRIAGINYESGSVGWGGQCVPGSATISLELVIMRCFPTADNGEAPTATEVTASAIESMEDRARAANAIQCCPSGEFLGIQSWSPMGPSGLQFGGRLMFSIRV